MSQKKRWRDEGFFRFLLNLFPFDFRHDYGRDMEQVFREQRREAAEESGFARLRLWSKTLRGVFSTALSEHFFILGRDARYAIRSLWQAKVFTLVVVLTLAVGIGANTAIFSVVNGVLLQPLPYDEPERLVRLYETNDGIIDSSGGYLTGPDFVDFRDSDIFDGLAAFYDYQETSFDLSGDGAPMRVTALSVSSGFFEVLRAGTLLGRTFTVQDETAAPLVVLSEGLWRRRFSSSPDLLGQQIILDANPYTVIGVIPGHFRGPNGSDHDLWIPLDLTPGGFNQRGNHYLSAVGRLKPLAGLEGTSAKIDAMAAQMAAEHERFSEGRSARPVPLHDDLIGETRAMLYMLLGAVASVLLIGCANVANMFLARGASRERELAIRTALGSGRARLVRGLLTENVILAATAGVGGLAIAYAGVRLLLYSSPASLPLSTAVVFDQRILAFAGGLSLATAVVFGLLPAAHVSRTNLTGFLAESSPRSSGSRRHQRFRSLFVLSQVSLAMILLVGAGLLTRSFVGLASTELGFRSDDVLTYTINLPDGRYPEPEQRRAFYREYYASIGTLPGVESAGGISRLPASGDYHIWGFRMLDLAGAADEDDEWGNANIRTLDGNYFGAMDVTLQEGRLFEESDQVSTAPVAVVNRALAERFYPDREVLGKTILVGGAEPPRTIVGIVEDTRQDYFDPAAPKIYIAHRQFADNRNWSMTQVIRSTLPTDSLLASIRTELARIDQDLVLHTVRPMDEVAAAGIARQRFAMILMGCFSAIALLLAATGIYGVLAYTVSQRLHEIGIRKALGARESSVWGLVMTQGFAPVLGGILIGGVGAYWLSGYLATLVHEVSATDPAALVGGAMGLVAVAFLAAAYPARRASQVDPIRVLRGE